MATELNINENTYGVVTTTLTSDGTTAIASASVDAIVCTLIETQTGTTINSRSNQNVFNANNCTLHATSGLFTWNVQPEDTTITGNPAIGQREHHLATFSVTWNTTKQMHFEIMLNVLEMRNVPQA